MTLSLEDSRSGWLVKETVPHDSQEAKREEDEVGSYYQLHPKVTSKAPSRLLVNISKPGTRSLTHDLQGTRDEATTLRHFL